MNELKNLVSTAKLFLAKNKHAPILQTVCLKMEGGKLSIEATDLSGFFSGTLEVNLSTGDVISCSSDATKVCVDPKLLLKAIKKSGNEVYISKDEVVVNGFKIKGLEDLNFPEMLVKEFPITIIDKSETDFVNKLIFAGNGVLKESTYTWQKDIKIDIKRKYIGGAHAGRMHIAKIETPVIFWRKYFDESLEFSPSRNCVSKESNSAGILFDSFLLPVHILKVAKYIFGTVKVSQNVSHARIDLDIPGCENCYAIYHIPEIPTPVFEDHVPQKFTSSFSCSKEKLLQEVKKSKFYDCEFARFTFQADKMIIDFTKFINSETLLFSLFRGEGENIEDVINLPAYVTALSVNNLFDMLSTIQGDSIQFGIQEKSDDAVTITGENGYQAVLMPWKIEG